MILLPPLVKRLLKELRASQPFNAVTTSLVRGLLRTAGLRSELAVRHLHRMGDVGVELPNGRVLKLWSRGDDWVSNLVYWQGWDGYEPETVPFFYRLATRARVTCDVGAYVGYFSLLAAHASPHGRVFAFEPLPTVFARLRRNVELNGLSNVECSQLAVGKEVGTASFYSVTTEMPTSSSLSYDFMKANPDLASFEVSVTTLDRFLRERGVERVDLLKIDTESTEDEVLMGMAGILQRDRPEIVCEVLEGRARGQALEGILGPLGYDFYLLTPDGPVKADSIAGHPTYLNYLFTCRPIEDLL